VPEITVRAAADRQHKHRHLWVVLAGALILGGPTLAVTIWAAKNHRHMSGSCLTALRLPTKAGVAGLPHVAHNACKPYVDPRAQRLSN
jgi:hypothetical protein